MSYIVWPKTIDSDLRAFYPIKHASENATHFMATAQLTSKNVMALAAVFGDVVTFPEDYPSEFDGGGDVK